MLFGTLVHETIEDIHRAALRHEEQTITEENVSRWFDSNYISLTKTEHTYLAGPQREAALKQVLRYVDRQHGDWSAIQQAEVDVSLVKPDYIIEGKVDLIRGEGDTVEIVDFKAERKPDMEKMRDRLERYRRQLHIYAHLVEERTGRKVSKMHLYYWYCCTSLRMPDTMSSPQRTTLCLQTIIPALNPKKSQRASTPTPIALTQSRRRNALCSTSRAARSRRCTSQVCLPPTRAISLSTTTTRSPAESASTIPTSLQR